MECRQIVYLFLGFAVFVSVMYWSSPNHIRSEIQAQYLKNSRPNFVFILTDDQDVVLNGMLPMMNVKKLIAKEGITLSNSFVASPLCCPSRSSILTGQYVHNHGAINNSVSGQCSSPRWQVGPEKRTFVTHLHKYGYETFFAGKYLNQYGMQSTGGIEHVPPGWDWWIGLKGNSRYYNYTLSVNGTSEEHGNDPNKDYLTKVISDRALTFLRKSSFEKPFFMMLSVPSAHAPFTPEPKYSNDFDSLQAPRTESFNIKAGEGKHWLLRQGVQPLPDDVINKVDEVFRNRLRTLLTVDDMVKDVIDYLEKVNELDNTYIIFTSDNGYHLGQFSLPIDKREPYETDIRVPFLMRGPYIPSGMITNFPTTNIDLAPTVLDLAGIPIPQYMDGISLKSKLLKTTPLSVNFVKDGKTVPGVDRQKEKYQMPIITQVRRTMLVEHSGEGKDVNEGCESVGSGLSGCNPDFACKCEDSRNNTYACLRLVSSEENLLYCKWNDDESFEEMYNLKTDPQQLNNTAVSLKKATRRKLNNLLRNLQRCRGARCAELGNFVI